MIPILTTNQIREADAYTIAHEPIASIDLMERASQRFVDRFLSLTNKSGRVYIFCGTGNNGGDGLAIGRMLTGLGYSVWVIIIGNIEKGSKDFVVNLQRFPNPEHLKHASASGDLPLISSQDLVVDALFGSGLSRPPAGFYAETITRINESEATVFSVDIASGLSADGHELPETSIHPDFTIAFQVPKLKFFLPKFSEYVGEWFVEDIGLHQGFLRNQLTDFYYSQPKDFKLLLKAKIRFSHKGDAGRLLLVAGKRGSIGAAILSAKAAMRSGLGLLMVHVPECGVVPIHTAIPEAMVEADIHQNCISAIETEFAYNALAIGPGIGQGEITVAALKQLLQRQIKPIVLDADAINILAMNKDLFELLPEGSILTPHPGEFQRLVGEWTDDTHKLKLLRAFCMEHRVNVVLKGAFSAVCDTSGRIYFNPTGNPGMATAGSGDVLTGIVGGLLAQEYEPFHALRLGVYMHGLAGDLANKKKGEYALIASDIIDHIADAFKFISG